MEHQNVTNKRENLSNGREEALEIINWMETWQKYNASQNKVRSSSEVNNEQSCKRSKRERD